MMVITSNDYSNEKAQKKQYLNNNNNNYSNIKARTNGAASDIKSMSFKKKRETTTQFDYVNNPAQTT